MDEAPYAWRPTNWTFVDGLPVAIRVQSPCFYDLAKYDEDPHESRSDVAEAILMAWRKNGEGCAETVVGRRRASAAQLAAVAKGLERAPTPLGEAVRSWAAGSAHVSAVLFAMNLLALLAGRLLDLPWRPRKLTS